MKSTDIIKKAMERIILEVDKFGFQNLSGEVKLRNGKVYYYNIEKLREVLNAS